MSISKLRLRVNKVLPTFETKCEVMTALRTLCESKKLRRAVDVLSQH